MCSAATPPGPILPAQAEPQRTSLMATTASQRRLASGLIQRGHLRNLLLQGVSRVGVASVKSATTGRTYWAMEISRTRGHGRASEALPKESGGNSTLNLRRPPHTSTLGSGGRSKKFRD
jgi:hypothetical protein